MSTQLQSPHCQYVFWKPPGSTNEDNTISVGGGWYFSDEMTHAHGPFDTDKLAINSYDRYVEKLNIKGNRKWLT